MKKRVSFLLAAMLSLALAVPAWAAGFEDAQLNFVTDEAGILTDGERAELEQRAEEISNRYECGVYIIVMSDFTVYVNDDTPYEAAKSLYTGYSLGYGPEKSGVLLMLSMDQRSYALIAYGYGNTAFTDYGKDKLSEAFTDNFKDDDWQGGLQDYLKKSASMLKSAREGHPLDVGSNPLITPVGIAISLFFGFVAAFLICWTLKERQMKSVAAQVEADAYLSAGSVEITRREDLFTHTTETRTKIERNTDRSGGGGGTTTDSDGFSGKSGSF